MGGQHACQVAQASSVLRVPRVLSAAKLRFSVSDRAYTPTPSRDLHKFRPGLLQDILEPLRMKVNRRKPDEHHARLMIDEMQLTPGLVYDHSCRCIVGSPTLPLCDGSLPEDTLAIHGLVFLLGGLSTRWKQTIVNLLTGSSFSALALKEEIIKIIMACKSIGFKIHVVTSDMEGRNLALWNLFGIHAGRDSRPHTSCVHPCESGRKLWFLLMATLAQKFEESLD